MLFELHRNVLTCYLNYIEEINCCKGDSGDNRCFVIPIPPRDRSNSPSILTVHFCIYLILQKKSSVIRFPPFFRSFCKKEFLSSGFTRGSTSLPPAWTWSGRLQSASEGDPHPPPLSPIHPTFILTPLSIGEPLKPLFWIVLQFCVLRTQNYIVRGEDIEFVQPSLIFLVSILIFFYFDPIFLS